MALQIQNIVKKANVDSMKILTGTICLLLGSLGLPGTGTAATLIVGARVIDGTGAPAKSISVRIDGAYVVGVGKLKRLKSDRVLQAAGLVLAPGLIDTHSHHDEGNFKERDMLPLLRQGVTSIVIGMDGHGSGPLADTVKRYAAAPTTVNVASYSGHGYIRGLVMGSDYKRPATAAEVGRMDALLTADLTAGSLGLSTGLEYDPGIYSTQQEVLQLARTSGRLGGRYISHMRSEDVEFDAALDELLDIGRQTGIPVQISHLKLAMVDRWGQASSVLRKLNQARAEGIQVSADIYPYEAWMSNLSVLMPKRDFNDVAAGTVALTQLSTPQGMKIAAFPADLSIVGKTIAEIAAMRGTDAVTTYLHLLRQAEAYGKTHPDQVDSDRVIGTSMAPADIADFIAWPHTNICSDGELHGLHPRGVGSFAKIFRVYVREQKRLTMEEAIRKMSSLSAQHMGLARRGRIVPGAFADLFLFDAAKLTDRSTNEHPEAPAEGVHSVWVNGQLVLEHGKATHTYAGRFLKRVTRPTSLTPSRYQ